MYGVLSEVKKIFKQGASTVVMDCKCTCGMHEKYLGKCSN